MAKVLKKANGQTRGLRRMNGNKIIVILIVIAGLIFGGIKYATSLYGHKDINIQAAQQINPETKKSIVFYSDKCSVCKKDFWWLFVRDMTHHDVILVNLNSEKNKHYVNDYQIVSTPTLVLSNGTKLDNLSFDDLTNAIVNDR